jgi:ABC-type sugar transport system ATPase subunit
MAAVTFDNVTASVGGSVVLQDVSLDIADGEFVGVIGPSGSGKTSLLRTVAGFTDVVRGRLLLDGDDVTATKTAERDVSMVVQSPVLLPTRSVQRNVSFPLEIRRQGSDEILRRVTAEARAMHLEHLLTRRPRELSRGEAQLVQIARALVRTTRVLLLDEPFVTLDAVLARQVRGEVSMLQAGYGVTTLMATNDPVEAMSMPHRLVVVDGGEVVQVDVPEVVRRSPATVDAALATGDCRLVQAKVRADADGFWLIVPVRHGEPGAAPAFRHRVWHRGFSGHVDAEVVVGIRPADVAVVDVVGAGDVGGAAASSGAVTGTVKRVVPGSAGVVECDVGGWGLGARGDSAVSVGDLVNLRIEHVMAFDAKRGRLIG